MKLHLKKLEDQVIVITGASSGIGLATARMAAKRGANLVLSSRNLSELTKISDEINGMGKGRAIAVECDVKDEQAVARLSERAISEFGRVDTWINNAGITIFGKLWEVPLEEKREMFETNFWGVVYGCRSAVKALRENGGAIINIGSVLSERVIPLQGMYCASKHAVKAYTDALRMELEAEQWPISVTLIKPAAIDTPYIDHGVNHLEHHPTHAPPVYSPEIVAAAILDCAVHPRRDIHVGGSGVMFKFLETVAPGFTDLFMAKAMMEKTQTDPALDNAENKEALRQPPRKEGAVRGSYPGHVMETSVVTAATLHPAAAALLATGVGLAAAAGIAFFMNGGFRKKPLLLTGHVDSDTTSQGYDGSVGAGNLPSDQSAPHVTH
jgi:short-subunit dehydrogenase